MSSAPLQVTFAGWALGGYGGMETRILAAADLATRSGHRTVIRTGKVTPPGSATARGLEPYDHASLDETWNRTLRARVLVPFGHALAKVNPGWAAKVPDHRILAHRQVRRLTEEYWDGPGREVLARTDVLHLFGPPLPFVQRGIRAAHEASVPVLYQSVHEITAEYAANIYRKGFADCCNLLDVILVSHDGQQGEFAEHFGYTGPVIPVSQWAYEVEDALLALPLERAEGPVVVGTLCRLDDVKGLDVLVAAFARAAEQHPDLRLRIGGTGEREQALRAQSAALGIADRVELVGLVDDRAAFYRGIDVFALASRSEGGPVTGVEAMAAGLPIVSTTVGAMPERLADDTGVLVPVDDADALAAALAGLAADADRRRSLGTAARERYRGRYAEAAQEEKILGAWQDLAARRP